MAQTLIAHLWLRFKREYVPELTTRNKWFNADSRDVKVNDLVILTDEQMPRCQWRLGRVLRPISGPDGRVRVAELRTSSGTLIRPVARLCPLEL